MADSASLLYSFICKNGVCLHHINLAPNELVGTISSEIIQPSVRVICHSTSKTIFTEISLIHLKYGTTGKEENK